MVTIKKVVVANNMKRTDAIVIAIRLFLFFFNWIWICFCLCASFNKVSSSISTTTGIALSSVKITFWILFRSSAISYSTGFDFANFTKSACFNTRSKFSIVSWDSVIFFLTEAALRPKINSEVVLSMAGISIASSI